MSERIPGTVIFPRPMIGRLLLACLWLFFAAPTHADETWVSRSEGAQPVGICISAGR